MEDLQYVCEMPNYQISTSGCLWERKSCGTTLTLDFSTLGKKTTNKIKHAPITIQVSDHPYIMIP
jgi:hypothetical protein